MVSQVDFMKKKPQSSNSMRRVLMVSLHFPPDTSAATHRVRLLAPHLPQYGWEPTVVTVSPDAYEGRLDPRLAALVPRSLAVVRCPAWPARWTRMFGVGDLGLRAFWGVLRSCSRLLAREHFDALFITITPVYAALLGPILRRRHRIPFVLDYQDPWVGEWGKTAGPGSGGRPNWKSRASRALGQLLEPLAVGSADALTAVSERTYAAVLERNPEIHPFCTAIPIGYDGADYMAANTNGARNPYFDSDDGCCHLCYVGTLLPLGFETLRAVLRAVHMLREQDPQSYARLRLHFFGTSNERSEHAAQRVLPVAREIGVDDCVSEVAARIDYLDALTVQQQATAILLMGSSERHYTASKIYPGLLARRPILAIYHQDSSVVEILGRVGRFPSVRCVSYDDRDRAESRVSQLFIELRQLVHSPQYRAEDIDMAAMQEFSACSLAGRLAGVLGGVAQSEARSSLQTPPATCIATTKRCETLPIAVHPRGPEIAPSNN